MAWRWLEGLLGTNKSRLRRNDPKRRLRIEELESRRLLTIVSIGGVIDVSNFPGATGDVPVRARQRRQRELPRAAFGKFGGATGRRDTGHCFDRSGRQMVLRHGSSGD